MPPKCWVLCGGDGFVDDPASLPPDSEALGVLLTCGVKIDVNVQAGRRYSTPLICAARNNSPDCLKVLLDHPDTVVDAAEQGGWTALHWACRVAAVTCVVLLLEAGADVNAATTTTAAVVAAEDGPDDDCDDGEASALPPSPPSGGDRPLLLAAATGSLALIEVLLAARPRPDFEACNALGEDAIVVAHKNGHVIVGARLVRAFREGFVHGLAALNKKARTFRATNFTFRARMDMGGKSMGRIRREKAAAEAAALAESPRF